MGSNIGAVLILSSLATSVHVATAQTAGDAVVVRPGDTLVDPGRLVPHRATWRVTRRDPGGGGTVQGLWTDTWARSIEDGEPVVVFRQLFVDTAGAVLVDNETVFEAATFRAVRSTQHLPPSGARVTYRYAGAATAAVRCHASTVRPFWQTPEPPYYEWFTVERPGLTREWTLVDWEPFAPSHRLTGRSATPTDHELARPQAGPCCAGEFRQLDFWIGEWRVTNPQGQHVGDSRIERILNGCAIQEHWQGTNGWPGESYNAYNRQTKRWRRQFWVSSWGQIVEFTGEAREGEVVYVAETVDREGRPARRRMTLTRRGPDEVRQRSEISYDDGATWSEEYDFTYIRKQE